MFKGAIFPKKVKPLRNQKEKEKHKMSRLEAHGSTPTFEERVSNVIYKPLSTKMIFLLTYGNEPHTS